MLTALLSSLSFPPMLQIAALLLLPLLYPRTQTSLSPGQIQVLPKGRSILSFFRDLFTQLLSSHREMDNKTHTVCHTTVTLSVQMAIIFVTHRSRDMAWLSCLCLWQLPGPAGAPGNSFWSLINTHRQARGHHPSRLQGRNNSHATDEDKKKGHHQFLPQARLNAWRGICSIPNLEKGHF